MWATTIVGILVGSFIIARFLEWVKVKKFKNEATRKKMIPLALVISIALTPILYYGLGFVGKPIIMVVYAVIIYLLQKEIDMEVIRPILKKRIEKKVENL